MTKRYSPDMTGFATRDYAKTGPKGHVVLRRFFGNKATKIVHDNRRKDSCRAAEILPENLKWYNSICDALDDGKRLCKRCWPDKDKRAIMMQECEELAPNFVAEG
jgi:methylphosphotriester-DNA--protein-cysteine methyltransferase